MKISHAAVGIALLTVFLCMWLFNLKRGAMVDTPQKETRRQIAAGSIGESGIPIEGNGVSRNKKSDARLNDPVFEIHGRVLQNIGRTPVANAKVELFKWRGDLEEFQSRDSQFSGEKGEFRFTNLSIGKYELIVWKTTLPPNLRPSSSEWNPGELGLSRPDYEKALVILDGQTGGKSNEKNILVFEYGRIQGRVVDFLGNPIPEASVSAYSRIAPGRGGYTEGALTDLNGDFSIEGCPPGWVEVSVVLNVKKFPQYKGQLVRSFPPFRFEEKQNVFLGDLKSEIGDSSIVGRVIDQFGSPFTDLEVVCRPIELAYGDSFSTAITDDLGFFEITGIPAGNFVVDLTANAYQVNAPVTELRASFWEYPINVEMLKGEYTVNIGTKILQRPQLFEHTITWTGEGSWGRKKEQYHVKVTTEFDQRIQDLVSDAQSPVLLAKTHRYDWAVSPPWFNSECHISSENSGEEILTLSCLTPHAPVRIKLFNQESGATHSILLKPDSERKGATNFDGTFFR